MYINTMYRKIKNIHFIGIGGIGMSGIAEVLLNLGYQISGSDIKRSEITVRLQKLGVAISYGHEAANLLDANVVVTSTAVRQDNPEVQEAHRRGIPVIPRAEMLAELLKMKFSVAVSGCHGKTTTTSMIAMVLAYGGLDPTMVIGGRLNSIGSNAKLGDGEIIVAEADESDGSFLRLSPTISVITNIDREHLDFYPNLDAIKSSFLQFANSVPFYGATVLCIDDENVSSILPEIKRRTITYGLSSDADYQAANICFDKLTSRFTLYYRGSLLGEVFLNVPGLYNVYNAMATVAVARDLEVDFPHMLTGLESFTGVHRRMEVKGVRDRVTVVDDYGHHPTEIKALLAAARQAWKGRKIIAVFQPHRYTRTKLLFKDFLNAFDDADAVIITDIYAASEIPIEEIHASFLAAGISDRGHKDVCYMPDFDEIVSHLKDLVKEGDVIITLGAGNVWEIGEAFLRVKN